MIYCVNTRKKSERGVFREYREMFCHASMICSRLWASIAHAISRVMARPGLHSLVSQKMVHIMGIPSANFLSGKLAGSTRGRVGFGLRLFILLGVVMMALLLLIPNLVLQYHFSRLLRLLLREFPVSTPAHVLPIPPVVASTEFPSRCDSCNRQME